MSPSSPRSISLPERRPPEAEARRSAPAPAGPFFGPGDLVLLKENDFFESPPVLEVAARSPDFFLLKDGVLRAGLAPIFPVFFSADFSLSLADPVFEDRLNPELAGVFLFFFSPSLSSGGPSSSVGAVLGPSSIPIQIFRRRKSSGTLWMRCSGFFRKSSWMTLPSSSLIFAPRSAGSGTSSFR